MGHDNPDSRRLPGRPFVIAWLSDPKILASSDVWIAPTPHERVCLAMEEGQLGEQQVEQIEEEQPRG